MTNGFAVIRFVAALVWAAATLGAGTAAANDYIKAADILMERGFTPVQIYHLTRGLSAPCDANIGCGIETKPWTNKSWTSDKRFVRYLERRAGLARGELEKRYEAGIDDPDLLGAFGDLFFDVETGLALPFSEPLKLARTISTCYRRGQPWKDCKLRYNQREGCYFSSNYRRACAQSAPGDMLAPRFGKKDGMSSGGFAVGEFCWQGPKGDSIILPSKGVQSRISLKTARRLESGAKPPATGNYLKRKVCKDPSFLQTEERRYHGPVKYLAIKENGPLAYCAREQKQWRLVNGDYIMAEGAKFCGKEMALRFCRQQFYWGLRSYKRAKGLGASFFDSQTICKRNCDGFAEIVCNKPQYMIVGKYSEDGPIKPEPLPIKTVSAIPNISGFEIRDSFDLIGGDLSNARGVRSVKACAGQCTKAAGCAAFTYDKWNRWCFLKTSATQLRLEPKTVSGFLSRLAAPARLASNITLKHYRGKSFPYKGYKTLSSKSFEACGSVCLDEDRCVAFSFVKAGGDCKLLNSAGEYFSDSAVDSGVKRQLTK